MTHIGSTIYHKGNSRSLFFIFQIIWCRIGGTVPWRRK
jgi:hypothetical protein